MLGRTSAVQTTVFEERPLHVTLALQRRASDTSHHFLEGRAQSPPVQRIPSLDAELLEVEEVDRVSQGSLEISLGVPPPPLPDSHFAASVPHGGLILSSVSSSSNMHWDKVEEALASTRNVVGLFSPSVDDTVMLDMLKDRLHCCQGDKPGADFFVKHGGHRVVTTFRTILGEQAFRDLNAEHPNEESEEKEVSKKHVQEIDFALKMILAIPKDVAIRDVVRGKLKPLWTRVCEHADLNLDGTPKKKLKEKQKHVETSPIVSVSKMQEIPTRRTRRVVDVNVDVGSRASSQQRRTSSRLAAAQYVHQTKNEEHEAFRGLRRSKRTRDSQDVVDEDEDRKEEEEHDASESQVREMQRLLEEERDKVDLEEEKGADEEEEDVDEHQSQQPEKQPRLDGDVHIVTEHQHKSKDFEEEEKASQSHLSGKEVLMFHGQLEEENKKDQEVDDGQEEKGDLEKKKREREDKVDVDDPHVSYGRVVLTLMEEDAEATVDLLESLARDANSDGSKEINLSIPLEDLTPPSAAFEAERAERLLFEDDGKPSGCFEELGSCLAVDPWDESSMSMGLIRSQQHQKPVERIGVLMRWWRVVRRSFAFAGLWRALEKKRSRTKKRCRKSLKDMYHAKMEEIKSHSNGCREGQREVEVEGQIGSVIVYGYDQAVKYVQLGEFLIQYPQFVMQTLRIRLSDWLKPLKVSLPPCSDSLEKDVKGGKGQKRRPLIDIIKELLLQSSIDDSSLKRKDFENNKSSVKKRRTNTGGKEACRCCSNDDDDVVKCTECDCLFHEDCAGYEKGMWLSSLSAVGNKLGFFEGSVYCPDCLDEKQMTVMDVKDSLREQHGLAEYLNGEDCPYVFKHVDRDGFCLFRNLVEFVREEESLLMILGEGDTTDAVLCGKIIDTSLKMTEALRVDLGDDAVDSDALKALMDVQHDAKGIVRAIKSRWLDLDAEQIIRGFVQMFQGRVAVKVFRLSHQHPEVTEQVYPEERNGSERVICMFHWHSLLHFDRLIPNKHQATYQEIMKAH